ncbi:MAG: DEAD/DEAH box helicase [Verrucomicrobia bacterium]|nr:MAG: DEAD/DEAH box helicase [Verrucomicrobiota bacterium]TAE87511.1 MAG: DEAD/DEAH box helicase [Verrucomicrobiota bacterium]TAF25792.1 MAG: DEAD/DEAH box helicase [Verrucomicrobiota bacterium]TAF41580.1 MAG: DEAD/DEAH box helicase [Verrucomicrobiota bacterium]
MPITDYQSKYLAYELTKRCPSDSFEKLAGAVAGAQVDLNPHQVDAALFAFQSPLSKGAILADEVGLGKTIEAGLVISQKWAEQKRRILIITPSNLRKQWHQELGEKFFLPCQILESKSYNAAIKQGDFRPFEPKTEAIVICSYQFARNKASDVHTTPWDLVVIDEAHRLRNVYKPNNVIANILKKALQERHKILLTATPLQNSLLELFGLVSIIDDHTFGDLRSFREQFANLSQQQVFDTLKARLKPICHRTLRRQVTAYVPFTNRHAMVEPFDPSEGEDRLYHLVSDYLCRENLQALPPSQRTLMTLVLRKLLASSSFAIAGALTSITNRLKSQLEAAEPAISLEDELDEDYESLDETADEWGGDPEEPLSAADRAAIASEIADLEEFTRLALSIDHNAKGRALLTALDVAFAKARELGAAEKAIIFTESRKTQSYLLRLLADSPWAEGIVLFNGSNTDDSSKQIYARWLDRHCGSDKVTGSRTADMRSALVDYFREEGRIMIATEAGAEGINLQFCSLVVNYDLPWNPQRIEQRIGRCHRYGQKHDVVVVNFLNKKNQADLRVYQLLDEKFSLFKGVFGSSDEVLGAIESGVDFEKRIAAIYQDCRRPEEIKSAFDQLQLELNFEINEAMTSTRRKLLENFDDEVRDKLKIRETTSQAFLSRFERQLMQLTRHELNGHARFEGDSGFELVSQPFSGTGGIPLGRYELPRRSGEAHLYRLGHPLAEQVIERAKSRDLPLAKVEFRYADHDGKISILEPLRGKSGSLAVSMFTVESMDQAEDHLIFSACTDDETMLDEEQVRRLLTLPAQTTDTLLDLPAPGNLDAFTANRQKAIQREVSERNANFYEAEAAKLDGWADDLKVGLEREIKEFDRQLKETRRAAVTALTLEEKLESQKQIKAIENQRNEKRRSLFEAQDAIDQQRENLISRIEGKLLQQARLEPLFRLGWRVN